MASITMPFIEYKKENWMYSILPNAFKRRSNQFSSVYITDNRCVFDAAKGYRKRVGDFPYYLSKFILTKYILDGPFTINPAWQIVLPIGKVILDNKPIYINDTLILHLLSADSYDRIMPLIAGSYSRLILYGRFTWAQVERLIHANVKQVRIMGRVKVKHEEYDDVIDFVLRFARGFDYKFSFRNSWFPSKLAKKLACKYHKTHSLVTCDRNITHFVHKKSRPAYILNLIIICFVFFLLHYGVYLTWPDRSREEEDRTQKNMMLLFFTITSCTFPAFLIAGITHKTHLFDFDVHQDVMNSESDSENDFVL